MSLRNINTSQLITKNMMELQMLSLKDFNTFVEEKFTMN